MKISVLLSLLLFTLSCNVVQMVTQGETEVPDEFFQTQRGGMNSAVFFTCDIGNGWRPCMFSTKDNSVFELSQTVQPRGDGFSRYGYYKGNIFFNGWDVYDNIYRYDLNTQTVSIVDSGDAKGFTQFDNHLYYVGSSAASIRALDDSDFTPTSLTGGTVTYANTFWLKSTYNSGVAKLILCKIAGSDVLHEVNVDDSANPTTVTQTVIDPDGGKNEVLCGSNGPDFSEGHYVYADSGGTIVHYDVINDDYEEWTHTGTAADSLGFDDNSNFFYQENSAGIMKLYKYNIYHDAPASLVTTDSFNPSNLLDVISSNQSDEHFYVDKDGSSVDQLFRASGGTANAMTNFINDGNTILYFTIGSKGYYIFRQNGIHLRRYGHEDETELIKTVNIQNHDFKSFSDDELYNQH